MCVCLQIYSQYVEVSDALQQEKDENIRLKQYLDQILKVHLHTVIVEFKHFVTFDTCNVFQAPIHYYRHQDC